VPALAYSAPKADTRHGPKIAQTIAIYNMETQTTIKAILAQLSSVIVGKPRQLQDALACLLAGGHLLIEDVPGVGKTTLAHALAATHDPRQSTPMARAFINYS
jgi:MoxR-like ATPase